MLRDLLLLGLCCRLRWGRGSTGLGGGRRRQLRRQGAGGGGAALCASAQISLTCISWARKGESGPHRSAAGHCGRSGPPRTVASLLKKPKVASTAHACTPRCRRPATGLATPALTSCLPTAQQGATGVMADGDDDKQPQTPIQAGEGTTPLPPPQRPNAGKRSCVRQFTRRRVWDWR